MTNNPPAVTLELDASEAEWLFKLLGKAFIDADTAFRDVCSMPSSDPRAANRSMLSMAATADKITAEQLQSRIESQLP